MTQKRSLRALAGRLRRTPPSADGHRDGAAAGPATGGGGAGKPRCKVCGSANVQRQRVTFVRNPDLVARTRRCRDCGYIHIVRPQQSIWKEKDVSSVVPGRNSRIGTRERAGREFHMAKMAVDMLGREGVSVLVYGAGTNLDNVHIEKLPEVDRVAIGDIMKVRDDADFVDLTEPATEQFDIVIASEVVEHFRQPRRDFERLFGFVKDDGLVVAGTTIHAGNKLNRERYIFYPDHTSYYSPQSLRLVANRLGFHLDFRAPMNAAAMRKRYVYFSRSRSVLDDVACYFGTEIYPPSEIPQALQPPPQKSHAAWRAPVDSSGAPEGADPGTDDAAEDAADEH